MLLTEKMMLTDKIIREMVPGEKPIKLADGDGLFLLVTPRGGLWWRQRYSFDGLQKMLSLGTYPEITLQRARDRSYELRSLVANGIDPSEVRKADKRALRSSFEEVARQWWHKRKHLLKGKYADVILIRFEKYIFPYIGKRPVKRLIAADFLECFERMEKRGVLETAHKVKTKCSEVMRYAVATRLAERDPMPDLKGALTPIKPKHYATIVFPSKVGELMQTIHSYRGKSQVVHCALKLLPLVFVRSSELRYATWEEFEVDEAQWRIPAERMKRPIPHIVPLSRQAIDVLRELYPLTGPSGFLFPSMRSTLRPMSENTVNVALRNMGYAKDEMTGHGFRSMASTLLNEQGWRPDAIERQLAHTEENNVRAAYNYAEYLPERRQMMQAWADYLDTLRGQAGEKAVAVRKAGVAPAWLLKKTEAPTAKQQGEQE